MSIVCSNIFLFYSTHSSLEDVVVHANGIVVCCPGLFDGQVIMLLEDGSKSIVFVMMASKPDSDLFITILTHLCKTSFPQCIYN